MAKVTLTMPATVTMRDRVGTVVCVPTAGQSFTIAEAGGVTTEVGVVAAPVSGGETLLLAGSLNTITMADGHTTLAITSGGVIQRSGVGIPGGAGWSAVNYVPSVDQVWGHDVASGRWWLWGGSMTGVSWSLPRVPYEPGGGVPPVIEPPAVVASPAWFSIPRDGAQITLADGSVVTLVNGVVMRSVGGAAAVPLGASGSGVLVTVDTAGLVWHQSVGLKPGWWSTNVTWNPAVWVAGADPRPGSPVVVVPPPVIVGGATPRGRLLAYLRSIEGARCLIGQTTHSDNRSEFNAVTQALGFSPAIMFCDPWLDQWAGNAPFNDGFMPGALAHAKAGGIVGMSLMLPNPEDRGPSQGGGVDPGQLLTPGSALNNSLNGLLDQAAGLLQQFKDAGHAVLTRFLLELDGGWFWWGSGHFTYAEQTAVFRYIVNYLRVTKGLDNLLTTFATNGSSNYEYPGDDVTDIVGVDSYTDDLTSYKAPYEALRAQAPTKLFALTESGSGDPSGADSNYDENRVRADIQSSLPMAVYANFWSGWQPLGQNARAAMSDPFWINLSQVALPR